MAPSVVGTRMGLPEVSRIWPPRKLDKSPLKYCFGGTDSSLERFARSKRPSQSAKKNHLSFLMGPPMLPPSMFWMVLGLFVTPARFSSHVKARVALLLWKPKMLPWNSLVPDLVRT